ncbi:MAG: tetratricopeptide repeat protein [Sulfurovum sp.]
MSWNRIALTLCVVFGLHTVTSSAKEIMKISEDELIIRALLYDEYRAYENSYQVYKKLFDDTGAEVYLFREATAALMGKRHILESIARLKTWDKAHPQSIEVRRLLIPLYLTAKQIDNAKKEAEFLLEQSTLPIDLDLASNSFLYAGEFERALQLLNKIYATLPQEEILLRITEIMDEFTNQRKEAIQLLETHRRMNIVSEELYIRLLLLYQKEKDIDGILETYKAMYAQDDSEEYLSKIIDAYVYKRDIDGAIAFLEKDAKRDDILYELYKTKKDFSKALILADKLYEEKKDAKWIAEKGVLLFENAPDKNDKKMIAQVIAHLEEAIALGVDDSIYLNYYGYTLIDKEVDVAKGMKIIQDALVQQPDNTYYLDSLAWGYYKKHECTKAFELMKRVVDEEGLEEQEIVEHWDAIKKCK